VIRLEYEAYPPMARRQMEEIAREVVSRHGLAGLACVHRVGTLSPGEDAVVIAASAPHRRAALEAVEEYVQRLKQDVPIWKKEHFEGGAVWVGTPEDPHGIRQPAPEGAR
jgi:molybdopterin synthase catalytic subunit